MNLNFEKFIKEMICEKKNALISIEILIIYDVHKYQSKFNFYGKRNLFVSYGAKLLSI